MWVLVVWNPGLLIVDHMHFQYNGFLLGLLLLSLSWLEDGKDLMGGFAFAVLLCFKHLFAVAAPVYFVYLLRHYCRGGLVRGFGRLVMMGTVVVAVFVAAYGPFVYYGQVILPCFSDYMKYKNGCFKYEVGMILVICITVLFGRLRSVVVHCNLNVTTNLTMNSKFDKEIGV